MAVYHVTDGTSEADASKRLRITVRRTSSGGKHITLAKYKRKADEIEVVKQGMHCGRGIEGWSSRLLGTFTQANVHRIARALKMLTRDAMVGCFQRRWRVRGSAPWPATKCLTTSSECSSHHLLY